MISMTLPYPISVNAMYANVPGKGRVKTERYKTWLNSAGWSLRAARPERVSGPYKLEIVLHVADARRRDLDNTVKPVLDLLVTHGLVDDDTHCMELHVRKQASATAYAEVVVRAAKQERQAA